jgi:DNA-binding CsgD family transcriptional regulator
MSALLERERELAELDAIVGEARAGSGRLAVIEAPAGLGKTRLVQAARAAGAQAGMCVLAARATELERDFPFALVRQLFEPQLTALSARERDALFEGASAAARGALGLTDDDGGHAPQPAGDTFTVLHGLYWLTAALAERDPLLLAIDDAHWSDAASLDYLGFLLPRLEELPVLVVMACRPEEPGAASSLARIATDSMARRLTPGALSREGATTLLAAELGAQPEAGFAITCHEVSGGNPFYLCELARTLAAQAISPGSKEAQLVRELAPERITRTVLLRLARLSHEARAVARSLAVLGDDSDHRLVAALAGLDPDAAPNGADALRAAAILDPEASLRFIHPLVRNAVSSDLPAGERAGMHARAAALLRGRGAGPDQLAAHLVASEPDGDRETVETLLEAARRARASGAPRSAIAYLTRALREPPPAELRAAVLSPLITASIRASDQSVYDAIESDVLAELDRNPGLSSRWAGKLTVWMTLNGRLEQAIALLQRAIEVATREDDADRAFRLEAQLSTLLQEPPDAARARLARYRDRIEPGSASERLALALAARWSLPTASAKEVTELARRALDDGKIFAEQAELMAPGEVVLVLILADELDIAQRGAEQALAIARERNAAPELVGAWSLNGLVAFARGDLAAAEADIRQAVSLARLGTLPPAVLVLTAPLVLVLLARGELRSAEAELEANGMMGVIPDVTWLGSMLFARGLLHLEQGRAREAAEDFLELQARRERWGIDGSRLFPARAHAARALTALGEHERARELAEAELVHAERFGAPTGVALALHALGLTIEGPAGLERLAQAAAVLEDSPARYMRAYALCDLGAALRRANRRAEAREPLREALDLARRCGAAGLAKRAHDELAASGEKVRRYTPIGVESLTPSERRVAEMAASDMTNRQIAQTLFLTVKTIETHLRAAYDKLGIRSRHQLADALREPIDASVPKPTYHLSTLP